MTELPPPPPEQPKDSTIVAQFDKIQSLITAEFEVKEALVEHGIPTFYVEVNPDSKQAFTNLVESLANIGFTPVLREKDGRHVLKVAPKPETKPSRPIINVVLLLLTIGTVFVTGYYLSVGLEEFGLDPWIGAGTFALALLGILGVHEMAHKYAANHHKMEASMPYFIPGPPPFLYGIGTFGAVIVQKETAPNRDALFDIGASGPIAGFIVTIFVSAIGLAMSPVATMTEPVNGLPISLLFRLLANSIVQAPGAGNYVIYLHPVAFAGWIGMFITLLNLLPTGMLDGGHTVRSIISKESFRTVFTLISIIVLLFTGQLLMLAFVLFLSMYKHPGPLDDVSKLSFSRKMVAVLLVVVFALSLSIF